jgi:choline dehydrogenase-like flavoprotein
VFIGGGAGGGMLAWKLAPTGKRILLVERGDYLPASATTGTPRHIFTLPRLSTCCY